MRDNCLKIYKYLIDLKKLSGESKSWIAYMLVTDWVYAYRHTTSLLVIYDMEYIL